MDKKTLEFIHIGKCGGKTVKNEVRNSSLLDQKYASIKFIHIKKPVYSSESDYLFVVRNPIERAVSAFNWRYKLVVQDQMPRQKDRFEGEAEVLVKYGSLNLLAEALYFQDGSECKEAHLEFEKIHHLHERTSFYLEDIVDRLRPSQIYGVIKQYSLSDDCGRLLGSEVVEHLHDNSSKASKDSSRHVLSELARANLRRFLANDYACLMHLQCLGGLTVDELLPLLH